MCEQFADPSAVSKESLNAVVSGVCLETSDILIAERVNGEWVYYGYGAVMYAQSSSTGTEFKHWNLRGDLVAKSTASGAYTPAPITDWWRYLEWSVGIGWGGGLTHIEEHGGITDTWIWRWW